MEINDYLRQLSDEEELMTTAVVARLGLTIQELPDSIELDVIIKGIVRLLSLYTAFDKMNNYQMDAFCQFVTDEIKTYRKTKIKL